MEENNQDLPENWDPKQDAVEDQIPIERGDKLAMWIAGVVTVGLPCILLIGLIIAVTMLIFSR